MMNEYNSLLNHCREVGDAVKEEHFSSILDLSESLGISENMFAIRFGDLPKFDHVDLKSPETWGDAALCKSFGIGFVRMNANTKNRLDQYLDSKVF